MIYSKFYFKKNVNIFYYLGTGLILFIVFLFAVFATVKNPSFKISGEEVKMIEVTNLRPIQATVAWQSNKKEIGSIIYGEQKNNLNKIALDDRDVLEKKNNYQNHYVTVRDLKPGTNYFFKIVPGGRNFSFKTPDLSTSKNNFNQFFSKVIKTNLIPESNALVLLYIDEVTPLSTLTKDSGEWLIPLNSFYEKDNLKEKILSGREKVRVEIFSENNEKSTINTYLNKLSALSETIIMAKNYNFAAENENVLSASTSILDENQNKVEIIFPEEKKIIPGRIPLIQGVGVPNKEFDIVLNSKKTFSAKVISNSQGEWSYLPPENLELGSHSVTVTTVGFNGEKVILTRNFTLISNETTEGKVLGVASGEPTITYKVPSPTTAVILPTVVSPTTPVTGGADFSNLLLGVFSFFAVGLGLILIF